MAKSEHNVELDKLDLNILEILGKDARIPFKDVADSCGVSRASIHQRVQRMIDMGVITGSNYNFDPKHLSYNTCTYVGIKLERGGSLYREVIPKLEAIDEVVECHYTTGPYALIIKLYAKDNYDLMRILSYTIQEIPGVIATETMISLDLAFSRNLKIPK